MKSDYIEKLDFLLDLMVETDSAVTANHLIKKGYYQDLDITQIEKEFKYLQSVFKELNVADVIFTQDAELISPTHNSIIFQRGGGFRTYYDDLSKTETQGKEDRKLQQTINKLTAENLELQNKELKRKILFGIIGFIAGAIVSNLKDILALFNSVYSSQ